jgi:aspartate-semialdehyde dehydrogenase
MKIGIVGATGLVGDELIKLLIKNGYFDIEVCASIGSEDKIIDYMLNDIYYSFKIQKLDESFFENINVIFFCADNKIAEKWVPYAISKNIFTIDNSSAFRLDSKVPLVIPEINGQLIKTSNLIANPNCTTAILCMILFPLQKLSKICRVDVSTYQAVSGAGKAGIMELEYQMRDHVYHDPITSTTNVFKSQIVNNCFSHNTLVDELTGYNEEEMKIINETRKILDNDIELSATCIRIPVFRAHCESIKIKFENSVDESDIRSVLSKFNGVKLIDDRLNNKFPEPIIATESTDVYVGRIRKDLFDKENKTYHMFICGDQLLKGAAYNAFQIFLNYI